jgi:hypothetical protein
MLTNCCTLESLSPTCHFLLIEVYVTSEWLWVLELLGYRVVHVSDDTVAVVELC